MPLGTTPLPHILDHRIVQISHLGLRARHHLLIKFLEHLFTLLIAKLERSNPFNHLVHGLGLVSTLSVSKLIARHSLKSKPERWLFWRDQGKLERIRLHSLVSKPGEGGPHVRLHSNHVSQIRQARVVLEPGQAVALPVHFGPIVFGCQLVASLKAALALTHYFQYFNGYIFY